VLLVDVRLKLTGSNLTAAEDRTRVLETAFATLLPGVDLNAIVLSIRQCALDEQKDKDAGEFKKATSPESVRSPQDVQSGVESLPRQADGSD
jgi:hypothetical protein